MTEKQALPEGWRWVRFGDVVRQVKETTKDPETEGLTRIVGLEHLDSESLPLRRWHELGELPDGTSFTRTFRAGQVLFGKRRAYQRKVAVADFDGVCSGDILVFEPATDELLAEFLPYVVRSDGFFSHALGTSAGSLSPRTKWQELAKYEFPIPPVVEQQEVIELITAATNRLESCQRAEEALDHLINAVIVDHYRRTAQMDLLVPITDLAELMMGRQKAPKYQLGHSPFPYLRVANMGHLELDLESLDTMDFDERDRVRYSVLPGDLLLTEGDIVSPFNVGRSAVYSGDGVQCCFQNTLIRLRPRDSVVPQYLMAVLEGARLTGLLASTAKTTTVTHLGLKRLSTVRLPLADYQLQREIAEDVSVLLEARRAVRVSGEAAKAVQCALQSHLLLGQALV